MDYKCFVACRNGYVYIVSKGSVEEMKINIETKPESMVRIDETLVVAGMDNSVIGFTLKGKRSYTL